MGSEHFFDTVFRVTRSEGAPLTLRVKGIERTGVKFSVDLVPSFKLNISDLGIACPDLHDRIKNMIKTHNIYNSQVDSRDISI